jgi:hypothetical protein
MGVSGEEKGRGAAPPDSEAHQSTNPSNETVSQEPSGSSIVRKSSANQRESLVEDKLHRFSSANATRTVPIPMSLSCTGCHHALSLQGQRQV